ncbi:glycosyltransferase family 9 protein [Quadrisphaera sp. KR29]|uniref:glycosyltransferase family 9 protein n=1 Tax=Quadrisphaera sp. KR29 TaxID=3461391 RepID=UPI0040449734
MRSVLLVRLRTGMGDLVCTGPALRALRAARPDLRVDLLTWAEMAPVVDRLRDERGRPLVDELVDFPGHPGIPERPARPQGWQPWLRAVRERGYDLALQVYGANPAAGEVARAVGARRTGGFFLTTEPGAASRDLALHVPYPAHLHEVERHLHLLAHLGVPSTGTRLDVAVDDADRARAAAVLARAALAPGRWVALHAGATCSSRRWPAARFAAVAAGLVAAGWRVALTGVPAERGVVDAVTAALPPRALTERGPGVVDLCGATDLGAFTAALSSCALLVTNDTGAAHLASATGTPSAVVFLSGDPVRWAAPGPQHRVVRAAVECSPCPHLDCPIDHRCATRVRPADVLATAAELLGTAPPGGGRG